MKRIAILSMSNLYLTPYIRTYVKQAELLDIDIDIIYWNRHDIDESDLFGKKVKLIPFNCSLKEDTSRLIKLNNYFKFKKFAKEIINNYHYNRLIFLQTICAMLFVNYLPRKYRNKYLVDIRDYTMEDNYFFRKMETKLLNNSGLNVISSEYYKKFLPNSKYILTHNFSQVSNEPHLHKQQNNTINIYYVGLVRFDESIKWFINGIKNEKKIKFHIVGSGANRFKKFINDNQIDNVFLKDYFDSEDTETIFNQADIIYNLYGYNTPLLDYALSNKLYYAAQLKKPILTFEGTAMSEVSEKFSFGITIPLKNSKKIADIILERYDSIDFSELDKGTFEFLKIVKNENNIYKNEIKKFLIDKE